MSHDIARQRNGQPAPDTRTCCQGDSDTVREPACNCSSGGHFHRRPAHGLINHYPLCSCCFPDGEPPEGLDEVIRAAGKASGGQRKNHLPADSVPDNWEIAEPNRHQPDEYGTSVASIMKKPDVRTIQDVKNRLDNG